MPDWAGAAENASKLSNQREREFYVATMRVETTSGDEGDRAASQDLESSGVLTDEVLLQSQGFPSPSRPAAGLQMETALALGLTLGEL